MKVTATRPLKVMIDRSKYERYFGVYPATKKEKRRLIKMKNKWEFQNKKRLGWTECAMGHGLKAEIK